MVDGGKRASGREAAITAYYFPGSVIPKSYEEWLMLYLNTPWAQVTEVLNISEGVKIGEDKGIVPNDWIDLIESDPVERAKWRLREFRKL